MALILDRCQSTDNNNLATNQHDFKGWGENQRIMLHDKTLFHDLDRLLINGFRVHVYGPFSREGICPIKLAYNSRGPKG